MTPAEYTAARLQAIGITQDAPANTFIWREAPDKDPETMFYFQPCPAGIEINTPTVEGDRPHHVERNKKKYLSRIRKMNAGGDGRYTFNIAYHKQEKGLNDKGAWLFVPPLIRELYEKGERIRDLYVTEGEFKSFAGALHGLPVVGIPGIQNIRQGKGRDLLDDIKLLIQRLNVENVIMLYDSDCRDLSSKVGRNGEDADKRPRDFIRSAENFRRLLSSFGVNSILAYINPVPGQYYYENPAEGFAGYQREAIAREIPDCGGKWGLDDMLVQAPGDTYENWKKRCAYLITQLQKAVDCAFTKVQQENLYFSAYDITMPKATDAEGKRYTVLSRIFHLESVEAFWEAHRETLKDFTGFVFNKRQYVVTDGVPDLDTTQWRFSAGIKEEGNSYWGYDAKGREMRLSTFTMHFSHAIYVNADETKRFARIQNTAGHTHYIELSTDDLASRQRFKKKMLSYVNYSWLGSENQLNELVGQIEAQTSMKFSRLHPRLGWHDKAQAYAFADGYVDTDGVYHQVDEYGIVELDGERSYCLPTCSRIDSLSEQFSHHRWMRYTSPDNVDELTLTEWWNKFTAVYDLDEFRNGSFAASWAIMTVFSDIVFDAVTSVPMLYLTGIHRGGKSAFAQSITALFGTKPSSISLHSATPTGVNRVSANLVNVPVIMEEYKNDLPPYIIEFLKNAYDRFGKIRAEMSNDERFRRVLYNSTFIVSGQDIPGRGAADPALFSRGIMNFIRKVNFTPDQKARKVELEEYEKAGINYLVGHIVSHRHKMEREFTPMYQGIIADIQKITGNIDARILQNYGVTIAAVLVLQQCGAIATGHSREQWVALAAMRIRAQVQLLSEGDERATFWEVMDTLYDNGVYNPNHELAIIENRHLRISDDEQFLWLDFAKVYDNYRVYCQRFSKKVLDRDTMLSYLRDHESFLKKEESIRIGGKNCRALKFDRKTLHALVPGLNIYSSAEREKMKSIPDHVPTVSQPAPPPLPLHTGKAEPAPF